MKKVRVFDPEPALILVGSYQKHDLHQRIEAAIERSYKKKGVIKVLDDKKAKNEILKELKKLTDSNRKLGRRFDKNVTTAAELFEKALTKKRISRKVYRELSNKEKDDFWSEYIWKDHIAEIIDLNKFKEGQQRNNEKKRIRDRVRRVVSQPKNKRRKRNNASTK